jgi:glycosidase
MKSLAILIIAAAVLSAASADAPLTLSNGVLELAIDSSSGRWLSLSGQGTTLLDGAETNSSIAITYGGKTVDPQRRLDLWSIKDAQTTGPGLKLTGHSRTHHSLTLEQSDGDWRIRQEFALDGKTLRRRVRLTWAGRNETLLRWIDLQTPSQLAASDTILEAPGYPAILQQPLSELPPGKWSVPEDRPDRDAPAWRIGLFVTSRENRHVLVWPFDRQVPAIVSVHRGPGGVWLNHKLFASTRLKPDVPVDAGTQYVRFEAGKLERALSNFQKFWAENGIAPRHPLPVWARDTRIFEVHLGPYRNLNPYPQVEALTEDLPRIASLGFNVIQLMPRMPYPSYSVHDYHDIETHYAPPAALRAMVRRAHELGIKVILDVIMHGVRDESAQRGVGTIAHPLAKARSELFSRKEDGSLARTYTWAFDHASPDFRAYMVDVFCKYVRDLDIDGFRVDAITWNFFPNWAGNLPRPGFHSIYGSVELFEKVRIEAAKINPQLLFVTETGGPLFHISYDLSYNYDELWMYGGLLPVLPGTSPRGGNRTRINARQLARWLELRKLALPPTMLRIHQADSHDTKQSTNKFNREIFGENGMRVLFAWASFIDGAPMNFVGAEKGLEDFYREVLALRSKYPALQTGDIDYAGAQPTSDRVFAPFRTLGSEMMVPVIAFSAEPVATALDLSSLRLNAGKTYTLEELFTGETRTSTGAELRKFSLQLPAYAVQLWRVKK